MGKTAFAVFIHRSIKTRIETSMLCPVRIDFISVFIHRSIKTRIETQTLAQVKQCRHKVFIHRSIKTRIETKIYRDYELEKEMFLYIDPLKQGLKLKD